MQIGNEPLSLKELQGLMLEHYTGFHVWVKIFQPEAVYSAITDCHNQHGIVAIWCAGSEDDWLKEIDYGKTWAAYLREPED